MKTRFMIRLLVLGGPCMIALSACDSRELVAPGLLPAGSARATLTEPVSLGSKLLPPPPNTGGTPGPSVSLGSVPAKTWVVLQVSGSVSGVWNPDCNDRPPAWPCGDGALAQAFGGGADPYAPVTITYTYDQFGTHSGRVLLRGIGESAAIGLYINDFPSMLDGFAKVNTLTSWDPNFGIVIPSYYKLSGGYTVTATMVPSPFRVTESEPNETGTITYTAEPLAGLKFINPPLSAYLPAGDLIWTFFPGETSDEPNFGWPGEYVYECERRTVCDYRPPGPGRMQVSAYVEMQTAYVRSKGEAPRCPGGSDPLTVARYNVSSTTCEDNPKLVLECTGPDGRVNRVVRGKEIRCIVKKDPEDAPGEVTISRWDFEGQSRIDGLPTALEWAGPMARGGKVTVRGQIGTGRPQERSANISVEERQWLDDLPPLQRIICPPSTIPRGCAVHSPMRTDDDAGQTRLYTRSDVSLPIANIDFGPNTGWNFIGGETAPIKFEAFVLFLNSEIFDPGSNFYAHSNCKINDYPSRVEDHEQGHVRHAQAVAGRGFLNMHFEDFVRKGDRIQFERDLQAFVARRYAGWLGDMVDAGHAYVTLLNPGCNTGLRPPRPGK